MSCSLCDVSALLFVVWSLSLCVVCCLLFVVCVRCLLLVGWCLLMNVVCCLKISVCCALFNACRMLCVVNSRLRVACVWVVVYA